MQVAAGIDDVEDDGILDAAQAFKLFVIGLEGCGTEADLRAGVQDAFDAGPRAGCAGSLPDDRQGDNLAVVSCHGSHAGSCTVGYVVLSDGCFHRIPGKKRELSRTCLLAHKTISRTLPRACYMNKMTDRMDSPRVAASRNA